MFMVVRFGLSLCAADRLSWVLPEGELVLFHAYCLYRPFELSLQSPEGPLSAPLTWGGGGGGGRGGWGLEGLPEPRGSSNWIR